MCSLLPEDLYSKLISSYSHSRTNLANTVKLKKCVLQGNPNSWTELQKILGALNTCGVVRGEGRGLGLSESFINILRKK